MKLRFKDDFIKQVEDKEQIKRKYSSRLANIQTEKSKEKDFKF